MRKVLWKEVFKGTGRFALRKVLQRVFADSGRFLQKVLRMVFAEGWLRMLPQNISMCQKRVLQKMFAEGFAEGF